MNTCSSDAAERYVNSKRSGKSDCPVPHGTEVERRLQELEAELKATREALRLSNDRLHKESAALARSNQELEQFAYVSSHDLREPLRTIVGFIQILQNRYRDRLDAKAGEYMEFAIDGAMRLQQLIDDLLAYSCVGSAGPNMRLTDVREPVRKALGFLTIAVEASGAAVSVDPLPEVYADGTLLALLFQNLIGNSIKFKSEKQLEVHIGAKRAESSWLFSVKDNGIGMDMKYMDRIFVIFKRLHTRYKYPGTGIGLAICRKIVDQHGGKIWVESEPGKGSTFFFTIPDTPD